jgi:hypothetical protein
MGPSRRTISIPVALLLLLGYVPTLQAQFTRPGFWFSGGPGYGSASASNTRAMGGFSGALAGGWTLSPKLQLGLGAAGWTRSFPGESGRQIGLGIATLDARLRFYPDPQFGFFLTGGVGLGIIRFTDQGRGFNHTGTGILGGAGYDIRLTPEMSVSPFANYYIVRTDDPQANVGQIGVALTFH